MRAASPMAPAGLWEGWRGPDGEVIRTFAIITIDANEKLRALHDRMPVVLPRAAWPAWLGEGRAAERTDAEAPELLARLRPCPPELLAAWLVPRRVRRVAEDDAALAERHPFATPPAGLDDRPPGAG
jgi:putative SOS response-associated peptidase YedK